MKKFLTIILTVTLCFSFVPYSVLGETTTDTNDADLNSPLKKVQKEKYAEGEALILLEEDADVDVDGSAKSIENDLDLPGDVKVEDTFSFGDIPDTKTRVLTTEENFEEGPDVVKVSSKSDSTEGLIKKLEKLSDVKYAEPNYKRYSDDISSPNSYFDYQWGLQNNGQNGGQDDQDLKLENIWEATSGGTLNPDTIVAVVDTGVDYNHNDLKDRMWINNHTGKLSGKYGYDFVNGDADPMDDNGHGTHVSGIIGGAGGEDNGIAGIDKGAKIMALKAFDDYGEGFDEDILSAYEYIDKALSLGYKIKAVNNSWGSEGGSEIYKTIIETIGAKGCISVCAAGNEAVNIDEDDYVPAGIDSPYVISVAASTENGEIADFSNYGKNKVDIAAPGSSILSSVSYDVYNPTIYDSEKQDNLSAFFRDFEESDDLNGVKMQNWVDGKWISSGDTPSAGDTSSITKSTDGFFGIPKGSGGNNSLKWTVKNYDEDGVYNLYIPYETSDSTVPTQMSSAVKIIKGPSYVNDEYYGGAILVSDTKLKSDGSLPDNYNSLLNISFEKNPVDGFATNDPINYWENLNAELNLTTKEGTKRALVFTYVSANEDIDHEILLDDIGVSKGGSGTDDLGQYAFYSGTSMATPMVTGSLALLSDAKPGYSPEQRALEIAGMASSSDLKDSVASGGIVDMSNYAAPKPHILNAKISGGNVVINGLEFGNKKGQIKANGNPIASGKVSWSNKSITVPSANIKNRMVKFEVITSDNKTAAAEIYVVGGKSTFKNEGLIDDTYSGSLTTDGKNLYFAGYGGYLYQQIEIVDYGDDDFDMFGADSKKSNAKGKGTTYKIWSPLEEMNPQKMFPDATSSELKYGTIFFDTELSYLNGSFYTIARLDTGYSSCYALVAYNVKKDTWYRIADRPGAEPRGNANKDFANVQMSSLATYDGKIYLMGGFNSSTNTVSDKVQIYNIQTKKWSTGPKMPEGRFLGVARQTGDKLILSLGGNGVNNNSATRPLIFNGKTWSRGKAIDAPMKNSEYFVVTDKNDPNGEAYEDSWTGKPTYYRTFQYYNAAVGIIKGGLVYSGLASNSLGDTYTYSLSSNNYAASAYQYNEKTMDEEMIGISVGSKFYVTAVSGLPEYDDDDGDDEIWTKSSNAGYGDSDDYYGYQATYLYSMPVKSGLLSVTAKKFKKPKGTVSGKGKYLPGQKVTVKIKMKKKYKKKYYLKKMKVNSASTKKKKYTIKAIKKNVRVVPSYAKYKTKVRLNKKEITVKAGKTIKLKAKVTKAAHKKKGVKWSVSNKKYAKVSKKGKVKLKKAGKGKTVKVYAKAKDGSGVKAVCKIKIK